MTSAILEAPPPRRWIEHLTPLGIALAIFWLVVGVALLYGLAQSVSGERLQAYGGRILQGYGITLKLVAVSFVAGALLSIPLAIMRVSKHPILGAISFGYSYFFRGTPLIAQLFLIYYGAGQFAPELRSLGVWGFFRDAFLCAALAFTLNTAAYQAEILAGALSSIGRGQWEGAAALGVRRLTTLRLIIVPQALIIALRPYGNEIILLIKASAIASIVTVLDLMGQTRFVFSKTYDLSFYLWAAVFYLATVEILSRVIGLIERRLIRHAAPR